MRKLDQAKIPFRSPLGSVQAHLILTPTRDLASVSPVGALTSPIVEIEDYDTCELGETSIQLRESERYEYEVVPEIDRDLRLRCSLSSRRRLVSGTGLHDSGLIETRSFCGTLLMELVEGEVNHEKSAVASALLDVRSVKLDYRTEYRGMLRRLSDEIAGLVADARHSTKASYISNFEERSDSGWLQIQLEFLREILDSIEFSAALQRILSFPHERLSEVTDTVCTDRSIRWTSLATRQLVTSNPRRKLPFTHPLRMKLDLRSVAQKVLVPRKSRNLDTPENRFVKHTLTEFREFLAHAEGVFASHSKWGASAALARRLENKVEELLRRSFFRGVGKMRLAPLGSPVLQRKAGYREVLRWWLRFRTAAEVSWDAGKDLFYAGQRDVASLYEYWLFFELLSWFCNKCRNGKRPEVEELIEGLDGDSPKLRLRKQMELGPFSGTFSGQNRRLNARFSYNRRFNVTLDRDAAGSWTRRLHPDYTLTFWPEEFSESDAERQELLVHLHFDAKYRVENIEGLFGREDSDDADEEVEGNYKRQDLLKMHAYRDAIKRSQGAYVIYPGRGHKDEKLKGFHEILPGLGAFGVSPDGNGVAQGFEALERFLDEVLAHLGARTTAQERVSFHVAESYVLKESPAYYGPLVLPERDELSGSFRAPPPSEHHVVVAWYEDMAQLNWSLKKGLVVIRLGDRHGTWRVPPEFASARHVLLHTHKSQVADGLLAMKGLPGYKVFTAKEIKAKGYPGSASGEIYAIFEVVHDPVFGGQKWDGRKLQEVMIEYESQRKHREPRALGSRSAIPRVLSLQELLKAMR